MTLPRMPQAVVFDMDGLLCDTEVVYRDTMMSVATALGHHMPLSFFLSLVGLPSGTGDLKIIDHYGKDFPFAEFDRRVSALVVEACEVGIALKPGVTELLDHLDQLSVPRAIATSSSHRSVGLHLGKSGILPRFHAVVAKGDYAKGKPNPDPFLRAAERLGVAPEHCLALEDSHNGVRAAAAAGMMTVMVPDLLEATEEMHSLCAAVATDLNDVRRWLTPIL
jgi:HAD superfamily hydrolase (TIGR01509 family)